MSLSDEKKLLFSSEEVDTAIIGDVQITYMKNDVGGTHYLGGLQIEEHASKIYDLLKMYIDPSICIDVGANYGFTGILMRKHFPLCKLILVEPIPWMQEFLEFNFSSNKVMFDAFHSAIVSTGKGTSSFGVNERSTQDSRVFPQPGWITSIVETSIVNLSELVQDASKDDGVYIKIDTQGWEERVFKSGEEFLSNHTNWFIKTEFAPMWLESQGSDPVQLFHYLLERYVVYEAPARVPWKSRVLKDALGNNLEIGDGEKFVAYVRNLARQDRGWVDLYVLPRPSRRQYPINSE